MKYAVRPFRDGKYQEAIEEFDDLFKAVWWALGNLRFTHRDRAFRLAVRTIMNYYARAIDIVTNPEADFRGMIIEIAKRHPKAVCEVAAFVPWERNVFLSSDPNRRSKQSRFVAA